MLLCPFTVWVLRGRRQDNFVHIDAATIGRVEPTPIFEHVVSAVRASLTGSPEPQPASVRQDGSSAHEPVGTPL
jgi:hypothetical protein